MLPIKLNARDQVVVFNLPPPFNILWRSDLIVRTAIELCFDAYGRTQGDWIAYMEGGLWEYVDALYSDEVTIPEPVVDQIGALITTLSTYQLRYTQALHQVYSTLHPETTDYLTFNIMEHQPDLLVTVHSKDTP